MLMGFLLSHWIKNHIQGKVIITIVISLLWTASVAVDVYTQETNTSWALHAFFGAGIGLMYPEFFDRFTELLSRKK